MYQIKYVMPVLLLLAIATTVVGMGQIKSAKACDFSDLGSCFSASASPYYQGQQDGIWDHQHGLVYNPVGQCSTCSGEDFKMDILLDGILTKPKAVTNILT